MNAVTLRRRPAQRPNRTWSPRQGLPEPSMNAAPAVLRETFKVALMEDRKDTRESIFDTLSLFGWSGFRIHAMPTALEAAKLWGFRYFILDIDMGPERAQHGLAVLLALKALDPKIQVAVLSTFTTEYKARARSAGADIIVQKSEIKENVARILRHFCEDAKNHAEDQMSLLPPLDDDWAAGREDHAFRASDPNLAEFNRLLSESDWVQEHTGKFAAFVDGECVGVYETSEMCLDVLISSYPSRLRFYGAVGEAPALYELPGIYEFEPV